MTPELTIRATCPTCGGTTNVGGNDTPWERCPDCTDGTIRQAREGA